MPTTAGLHYFKNESRNFARPPVLLIHGAGGHHLYWPAQIRRMRDQRILGIDLPGHGKSEGIGRDRIEDYVEDVVEFMHAAGLNAAIWIGHSMGGAIALRAALEHPRSVLALGLVSTAACLPVDPRVLDYASRETTFTLATQMIGQRSFSPAADARLQASAMERMQEMRPTVLHGDLVACESFDVSSRLGEIRVPTIIVCGEDDHMIEPGRLDSLQAGILGSDLRRLPGAGHMVMLERPGDTADILAPFAASIPYVPGSSGRSEAPD